jgi:dolichol-phosphate mannosyltransferase
VLAWRAAEFYFAAMTSVAEHDANVATVERRPVIAAVVPCYRETGRVLDVLAEMGDEVGHIFVVDDACPDATGEHVRRHCEDPRVQVIVHAENMGVGGATITGYRKALEIGADIIVKVDGDGQMDPKMIPLLVRPIADRRADYAKGNRFHDLDGLTRMPALRLIGNLFLSFASKLSSGYWNLFDPTNGFTAIHGKVAEQLPLSKIDTGFFFESDILFRLNIIRAVIADIPMQAVYGDERSHLQIRRVLLPFLGKHLTNLFKRIFYGYFLRDFNIASVELVLGLILAAFGTVFGAYAWVAGANEGVPATAGTVFIAALPLLIGAQLLISFLNFDFQNQPRTPLQLNL